MYDYESDSGDSDGFELTSDFSSNLATKCDMPVTVLPEYRPSTQNQSIPSLNQNPEHSIFNEDIQEGSIGQSDASKVPVGAFIGRGRAWRRNVNETENSEVPIQVKQNLQRQSLSTSLDFQNSNYRPIGRGIPRKANSPVRAVPVKEAGTSNIATQDGVSSETPLHGVYDEELGTSVDPVTFLPEKQEASFPPNNLNSASNFDEEDIVEWDSNIQLEANSGEYILKPKVNPEFKPKIVTQSESVSFDEIRKTNPDVSPKWLASTLAKKQLQPRSDEMQRILRTVDHMWFDGSNKDKTCVSQYLYKVYTDSVNPFVLVGYLIDQVRDSHTAKTTTLAFFILKEFDKWYKMNKRKVYPEKYLSVDLQMHVFDICTRNHLTMLDMAVRCFHLQYPGNDHFLPAVKNFLAKKKYKEVFLVLIYFLDTCIHSS